MIEKLLDASIRFRWGVVLLTLIISAYGLTQLLKLPIDAVPDITNKQVQINTVEPNLGPLDIERLVTFPVETAMAGIPGLESSRSISRNGFSQVTVIFEDHTDLYFARQQVAERLNQAKGTLPDGVEPQMGPVSTGLGEVLMYIGRFRPHGQKRPRSQASQDFQPDGSYITPTGEVLTDEVAKLGYLRTVQDWVIRPQLRSVSGVAGIDSIGGYEKQFVVQPDATKLASYRHLLFRTRRSSRTRQHLGRRQLRRTRRGGFPCPRRWPHPHARRDRSRHRRHPRRRSPSRFVTSRPCRSAATCAPVRHPRTARRSSSARC